jgi:hypothetical protein
MASGSTKFVRWPWLILAALGFVGCVAFLLMSLTGRSSAPATGGSAAPARGAASAPMVGGAPTSPPPAAAPMPATAPAPAVPLPPTTADTKKSGVPADKPTASRTSKKVNKSAASRPKAMAAPAPPPSPMSRTLAADDSDGPALERKDAAPEREKPHRRRPHKPKSPAAPAEQGSLGYGGQLDKVAKGPPGPPATGEEDADAHGAAEAKAFADLLPGRFSAKVPQRMLINESVRVRATVAEKKDERKAAAVIEAAPVGPGPSKIVSEDVMVGKLLRVELRGLSREFEIMPITPAEQRLYAGRVAQWEWVVVPREEGSHELSIVVTNLYDWSGRPLDLTVHSALVSVDVTTMQRLRGYASVVSSIFSGITGLIGAWMALLRPFLRRRAEKEEDDKEKKKEKEAKDGADAKPAEKSPEKPVDSAAAPAAPVVAPVVAPTADAPQRPAE